MREGNLTRLHTIISLLFYPLFGLGIFLWRDLELDLMLFFGLAIIYVSLVSIIGTYKSKISPTQKKVIVLYYALSAAFFIFMMVKEFNSDLNIFAMIIVAIWALFTGIIGIQTNTILLSNGEPFLYKNKSLFGIGFNILIILGGIVLLYFVLKD